MRTRPSSPGGSARRRRWPRTGAAPRSHDGGPLSSLAEVAAELRGIAAALPVGLLGSVADLTEEAATLMAHSCAGTTQPDLIQVTGVFAEAHTRAHDLLTSVIALRDAIHAIADSLTPQTPGEPASITPLSRTDQIRTSLPRGVKGAQAQGRWLGPGTDLTVMRSGTGDEWYDKALAFAATLPPALRQVARLATHVEVKLAVRMREEGRLRETVIIDREVCGTDPVEASMPFTCAKKLHWFLPPNSTLTVIERDGTVRTYRGRDSS